MGLLDIHVDIDAAAAEIQSLQETKLPLIIARSLTAVAQKSQQAVQGFEAAVFTERNDWTTRNTKITPANRQTQTAEVYTDTGNRKTGAPDYLPKQQDGGEKVPVNGREHLAIPTTALRNLAGGKDAIIPDWLRPSAMLKYADTQGTYTTRRGKQRNAPAAIRGMYFFKVRLKTGAWAILARKASEVRENACPMYLLVTRAHLRKRFPMEEVVEETVLREFAGIFETIAKDVGVSIGV